MTVTQRPETPEDEAFLRHLIVEAISAELSASSWPEAMRGPLLDMQYRARQEGIRANYPGAERTIILADGEPVGRLAVFEFEDEVRLVDIAILAAYRRQGIGSAVIQGLLATAARERKPVRLNVNMMNPALRLYQRLGFRRTSGDAVQHLMEWSATAGKAPRSQ